jgi:hypothetical protein
LLHVCFLNCLSAAAAAAAAVLQAPVAAAPLGHLCLAAPATPTTPYLAQITAAEAAARLALLLGRQRLACLRKPEP